MIAEDKSVKRAWELFRGYRGLYGVNRHAML